MPQSLSQAIAAAAQPNEFSPANDPGAPAAACGREVTGPTPASGQTALAALVRLLGRQAAREFVLAPANDDAA